MERQTNRVPDTSIISDQLHHRYPLRLVRQFVCFPFVQLSPWAMVYKARALIAKTVNASHYNMVAAVDPTYPLYPIACILASALLFLVLLTSFIRQSWNLGIAFLCFWLFLENLTLGVNTIIWSDNADIKFHLYCDIGQ